MRTVSGGTPSTRAELLLQRVHVLAGRPDGGAAALHVGHGARAADGPVHLERVHVGGADRVGRLCERGVDVARVDDHRVARRQLPHVVVVRGLAREAGAGAPGRAELCGALYRLPRLLGHDPHVVLPGDDLDDARQVLDGAFVDAHERRADGRRPHRTAVQHLRHAHVVDELGACGHERRNVEPRDRLAQDRPFARMASGAPRGRAPPGTSGRPRDRRSSLASTRRPSR